MRAAFLLMPALLTAATVRTNFEGGSLGRVEKVSDTHFRLGVKGEKDQDGRNRQGSWYYFAVEGAPKREMILDIVDLPGEYNYKPNRGAITDATPPVISYDGVKWTHIESVEYDAGEPRLRLRVTPAASRFRIAHVPPYTNEHLGRLREESRRHSDFNEQVIGKTPGGRDLFLWTIHDADAAGRRTIWLMFRQHSWEAGSSWVGDGAVRALLAPEAADLRRDFIWKIFPLCDPDGVARGGVRFNAQGYDLNRNWDVQDKASMPEITAQRAAVSDWLASGQSIDLFLSLHNTETSEYLQGPPAGFQSLAARFFRSLKEQTTFAPSRPLFFAETTTTPGKPGRMTVVQGLYRDFKIPAFLMEQRIAFNQKLGRLPTVDDRVKFGGELVRAAAAAVSKDALVCIPPSSSVITDPTTGIPVKVRISGFLVSRTEVTQADYQVVTGSNPSQHKGDDLPVENVSWWDAIRYCNLRSAQEGLEPCYDLKTGRCDRSKNGYRLLTDAEWTHAAGRMPESPAGHFGPAETKDTRVLVEFAKTHSTQPAGKLAANEFGLHDMYGNVWEWVQDHQDPSGAVSASHDPAGPSWGTARVLRGGSWLSTSSRWGKGYRSSMEADRRSGYTGFRICRTDPGSQASNYQDLSAYHDVPPSMAGQTGTLSSLIGDVTSQPDWHKRRKALRARWADLLGQPASAAPSVAVRHVATHHELTYTGELKYLQVEPDYWEKIYVMLPVHRDPAKPLPVVIVPFYDVDTPAGRSMGGRLWTPLGTRAFGHLAVQHGFAAVAIRWFGESYGENYAEAVANLKLRHPNVTGLGKWVWDSKRLLDYIATRPELDRDRVGMIGHSLGGKMTLYAAAMDDRIHAAVSSEPGIGLSFSNYEDFWYLGEDIRKLDETSDHHELLALIAPRPFLLIGGDSADSDKSWHYINSARSVYSLLGHPDRIGYVNHRKGHSPTPESVHLAMEWLARFLRN